ncbi:sugar ABC transporter permease [Paenibacillus montaniterrae]|uniref:Sugar ABC transporter permease n=1 Tax=Paenibacillus montaniterrae TaxID=429341 RepID=A0A919YKF6_9BACL|nr:carbohydrate ABC transporter permease [Paenibacillus montaniterrae]GIP16052.1 sugar ABC transporter permease [Paenibacillus montaniterrae]
MRNESPVLTWFSHIVLILFSAACIIPFILLISASLTDQNSVIANGYSLFPREFSTAAYEYLFTRGSDIIRAYGVTLFVTVVGTVVGLSVTLLMAYPLSRSETPYRGLVLFLVFFSMLFSGGMIPSYLVYASILGLKNTIWVLIVAGVLTNGYYIMMMRVFMQGSISKDLIESAQLDGANEYRILWSIIIPTSTPILAVIGLFTAIYYWNDWQTGMIYITKPDLYSIQNLLKRIMDDVQFIQSNLGANAGGAMAQMPTDTVKMAIAVCGSLPILIAYPFFQKFFIKGIMFGAVKG